MITRIASGARSAQGLRPRHAHRAVRLGLPAVDGLQPTPDDLQTEQARRKHRDQLVGVEPWVTVE